MFLWKEWTFHPSPFLTSVPPSLSLSILPCCPIACLKPFSSTGTFLWLLWMCLASGMVTVFWEGTSLWSWCFWYRWCFQFFVLLVWEGEVFTELKEKHDVIVVVDMETWDVIADFNCADTVWLYQLLYCIDNRKFTLYSVKEDALFSFKSQTKTQCFLVLFFPPHLDLALQRLMTMLRS